MSSLVVSRKWEEPAKAAKIAVWWDMKDCPIPEGYDARLFRPSLEAAFKSVGYSGPVSITAYGDQTQTPDHILRVLSSTGVAVAHTRPESTNSLMYADMVEWRGKNPAPASMMIISNQVHTVFAWDLARLQQRTLYNLFLVYSIKYQYMTILKTCREWVWERLLGYADDETRSAPLVQEKRSDTGELSSATLYCKSCNFDSQSPENFRKHLSSYKHKREEAIDPTETVVDCVTEEWARDYPATPEYATAQIAVWWDLFECPIPKGYDARRVRPSLEAAFKNLGYSGPVSITAFGDLNRIPDHLLVGLSSTGVNVVHTGYAYKETLIYSDIEIWVDSNPPPATIMVIANRLEPVYPVSLVKLLQVQKHKLFLAYLCRPRKMSALLTSAEWLWERLLAVSETRKHVLHKCSTSESFSTVSETRKHVLHKCSTSESFSTLSETSGHVPHKCSKSESFSTLSEARKHLLQYGSKSGSFSTVSGARVHVFSTCSEAFRHVIQKFSKSESDRGESTSTFNCEICFCYYESLDDFRTHLSTEEHTQQEGHIIGYFQSREKVHSAEYDPEAWREVYEMRRKVKKETKSAEYDRGHWLRQEKRRRKAFRTIFPLRLRLTNRGGRRPRRKSPTCKKE
ncbi:PREDICTED: uncharacterized protein LOC104741227 isoform X1 [Camelina sativa]|uniref:Uncharacterized protein LOC104741227 isoform X1 n=1 Tax=Camelina sativa TaxID=90675 RepID=A0ABM1R4A5_CAMSA|nr:PREDICTED: uncharacterized protein LOC104741227 isoform X1 [Camelina sativa]